MDEANAIRAAHRANVDAYTRLVHGHAGDACTTTWDLVVLTAADALQARVFEARLGALPPLPCAVRVLCDPPDVKIGSGGSTMVAIDALHAEWGDALYTKRVLLLHAGGQSQRIPHHSAAGKVFAQLPCTLPGDDRALCMLEILLINMVRVPAAMAPGVFLVSSDVVLLFDLPAGTAWHAHGLTALAIHTPLETAAHHGVFVLEGGEGTRCAAFLHKPPIDTMRARGAVRADGYGGECALTDSVFFLGTDVLRALHRVYTRGGARVLCELEAYRDFLMASVTPRDTYVAAPASAVLASTRGAVWDAFAASRIALHVHVCAPARFYHIGTMPEYVAHFDPRSAFCAELGARPHIASHVAPGALVGAHTTLLHSHVSTRASVGARCVVEHSRLTADTIVGEGSIVSHCDVRGLTIPPHCLVQTVPLDEAAARAEGVSLPRGAPPAFAAFVLGVGDDVKELRTWRHHDLATLAPPPHATHTAAAAAPIDSRGARRALYAGRGPALWSAALFPVAATAHEACALALRLAADPTPSTPRLSLGDLLRLRRVDTNHVRE